MKQFATTAILGMLFLTSCGNRPGPGQIKPLTPDEDRYAACLSAPIVLPKNLPALSPLTVPAGTPVIADDGTVAPLQEAAKVVLLSTVNARDSITTDAYLSERSGRQTCQSAAQYSVDWIHEINK